MAERLLFYKAFWYNVFNEFSEEGISVVRKIYDISGKDYAEHNLIYY